MVLLINFIEKNGYISYSKTGLKNKFAYGQEIFKNRKQVNILEYVICKI